MVGLFAQAHTTAQAQEELRLKEANNQIRRDKFDIVLPQAMRKNNVDMWIHIIREAIPDSFGAEELGSSSGVFVFTDRGGDRIERAILGRRWGASQREQGGGAGYKDVIEELGAYDIIGAPVFVKEPLSSPMTENDYRFKGLRAFVAARDPQRIAVNFKRDLAQWATYRRHQDGISHTDYILLAEELGEKYANRLVSSEYVLMDYIARKVPSEIELLRSMRKDEIERVNQAFAEGGARRNQEQRVRSGPLLCGSHRPSSDEHRPVTKRTERGLGKQCDPGRRHSRGRGSGDVRLCAPRRRDGAA